MLTVSDLLVAAASCWSPSSNAAGLPAEGGSLLHGLDVGPYLSVRIKASARYHAAKCPTARKWRTRLETLV